MYVCMYGSKQYQYQTIRPIYQPTVITGADNLVMALRLYTDIKTFFLKVFLSGGI